jgi:hypothetical protein
MEYAGLESKKLVPVLSFYVKSKEKITLCVRRDSRGDESVAVLGRDTCTCR